MKLEQCLFGYDDGHRLLASSLPLGLETSLLTELSDLAPGTVFGQSEGYWTGFPAPSIGHYILMRTWPAPEMSRPGCVWTHALLIKPAILESIPDLSILQKLFIRPKHPLEKSRYKENIKFDPSHHSEKNIQTDIVIIRKLFESLYEMNSTTVEITTPGELDNPLFAVWSQQWPRLRRNFRFQTAVSRTPRSTGSVPFDVTAILAYRENESSTPVRVTPSWLSASILDIQKGTNSTLRLFLWRYGQDVRRQRGSFRPLVEVSLLGESTSLDSAQRVTQIVTEAFPSPDDAVSLKQDLVDGVIVPSTYSTLIHFIVLDELNGEAIFPTPTPKGIVRLKNLWPKQSDEVLMLAEITADTEKPISKLVFETVINIIQTPEFWPLSSSYPSIRKCIAKIKPNFLINSASDMDDDTLLDLLPLVSANAVDLTKLITTLLKRNNQKLAKVTFNLFPDITAVHVISAINNRDSVVVDSSWLQELLLLPNLLLQIDTMSLVTRMSLLYDLASSLGWLSSAVTTNGVSPWSVALSSSSNDLPQDKTDTLYCFLVALAFTSGGDDGLHLIERFFKILHGRILNSKLSFRGRELLSQQLPDLGWIKNWDLGLRFRLAVATAYVRHKWPPNSYAELTDNEMDKVMLSNAALSISGGHAYFKAISR